VIPISYHVMLDAGLWLLDQERKKFSLYIKHLASSIQYRFASSNGIIVLLSSSV